MVARLIGIAFNLIWAVMGIWAFVSLPTALDRIAIVGVGALLWVAFAGGPLLLAKLDKLAEQQRSLIALLSNRDGDSWLSRLDHYGSAAHEARRKIEEVEQERSWRQAG